MADIVNLCESLKEEGFDRGRPPLVQADGCFWND